MTDATTVHVNGHFAPGPDPTHVVEQAVYGERGGAHHLLAHSPGPAPFAALTGYTDLPSAQPPGVGWTPFESVFAHDGFLVVERTFPDPAPARPGMVVTHAVLVPLEAAVRCEDLSAVAALLPTSPIKPSGDAEPARLPVLTLANGAAGAGAPTGNAAPSIVPHGRQWALARALLTADGGRPVVWVGQAGFWEAVCALWRALWPAARRRLAARLSFGPHDATTQPLTVVATPEALVGRWPPQFRVVRADAEASGQGTAAEALLTGDPAGDALVALLADLEVDLGPIRDLRIAEQILTYTQAAELSTEAWRSLARLVAKLAPAPTAGVTLKRRIAVELAAATRAGQPDDVLALANFDETAAALPNGTDITAAVREWVEARAISASAGFGAAGVARLLERAYPSAAPGPDAPTRVTTARARDPLGPSGSSAAALARDAASSDGSVSWGSAVRSGVAALVGRVPGREVVDALWAWWIAVPALVGPLGEVVFAVHGAAQSAAFAALADAAPARMPAATASAVRMLAAAYGAMALHAAAVVASLPPAEAIAAQLAADPDPNSLEGMRYLAGRVSPEVLIGGAVGTRDVRLVARAGEAVARDPSLLALLDPTDGGWQRLWQAALAAGAPGWAGVDSPATTATKLADATITDEGSPEDRATRDALWRALARFPDTDLTTYPTRPALWAALTPETRDAVIAVTADRWLAALGGVDQTPSAPEPPLAAAVTDPHRTQAATERWLSRPDNGAAAVLALYTIFPTLSDAALRQWLARVTAVRGGISATAAGALGELVREQRWSEAARDLAGSVRQRPDLRPAADVCRSLLDVHTRLRLAMTGAQEVSADEAWEALEAVTRDLYPWGPGERHIWERAGGAAAELRADGSGGEQWAYILRRLRRGGTHTTPLALLEEMRRDFPTNDDVGALTRLQEFAHRSQSAPGRRQHRWF